MAKVVCQVTNKHFCCTEYGALCKTRHAKGRVSEEGKLYGAPIQEIIPGLPLLYDVAVAGVSFLRPELFRRRRGTGKDGGLVFLVCSCPFHPPSYQ